ncbi:hypothetical protein J437_LFUL015109 [Ladona fulva]|uniref:Uncharacterized protein n=1 Tax=Ladona fulva TaxID=123851 RepID=A0A8K0KG95_LADFU|nr:hypothetical protein J437_LFUL015109 [Ladona fulva]
MSASGNCMPPVIIFARKRMKPELMNGAPLDSMMLCSDSGYSNSDLFLVVSRGTTESLQKGSSPDFALEDLRARRETRPGPLTRADRLHPVH